MSFQSAQKQRTKGSSIVDRLMEITQGNVLSTQTVEPLLEMKSKTLKEIEDTPEVDPVLVQSVRGIVLTAAHVLAGATDSEESEW